LVGIINVADGFIEDEGKIGINTMTAARKTATGVGGAYLGAKIGAGIGSLFGGLGAIPGGIIGGMIGGWLGSEL
jgi:hypothetical protein